MHIAHTLPSTVTEANKRPTASRDITELKARLGLKKTGAMTAVRPAVAPPPGMEAAPPAAPRVTEDPFGAMAAMAQPHTQRQQDFVVVNDGRPVEQVQSGSTATRYLKVAAICLVPLVIGMVVGGAGKQNAIYNRGVSDAGLVLQDVSAIRKELVGLGTALEDNKGRVDKKLTAQLDEFLKTPFQPEIIFKAQTGAIGAATTAQVNTFYAGINELRELVTSHVKQANVDDGKLTDEAAQKGRAGYGRYAVVVAAPADGGQGRFGAQLVELGAPTCTDPQCNQITSFEYSLSADGRRYKGDVASPGSVAPQQVIPLLPTFPMNGLLQGSEIAASEVYYRARVQAIAKKVSELLETGSDLEQRLKQVSNAGGKFTFFM